MPVNQKQRGNFEAAYAVKIANFAFAFHNKTYGNRLHAAGAKAGTNFFPEYGAQFVANQAVKHPTSLLSVYQGNINGAGLLNRGLDGSFGDFVKNNPFGFSWVKL